MSKHNSPKEVHDEYVCEYCGKRYVREARFLEHNCEQKQRHLHSKTPRGMLAYQLYITWLSKVHKARKVSLETFMSSSTYKQFVRFVDWGMAVNIADFDRYVSFMCIKNYPPSMWCMNEVYVQYLEFLDVKMTADDHLVATIKCLTKYTKDANVPVNQALIHMSPGEMIQLIKSRNLSPWVLLKSNGFKLKWKQFNDDTKRAFEDVIRPDYWKQKMANNPAGNQTIADVIDRLRL